MHRLAAPLRQLPRAAGLPPDRRRLRSLLESALAPYQRRAAEYRLSALIFTLFVAIFCLVLIRAERRTRRDNASLTAELTERRRAEEALNESQGLFSAFLDHIPAVVFVQDLKGRILYSNQAFKELPGPRGDRQERPGPARSRPGRAARRPARAARALGRAGRSRSPTATAARGSSRPGCSSSTGRARSPCSGASRSTAPGGATPRRSGWSSSGGCSRPRSSRASASWPAASPTTSTTC